MNENLRLSSTEKRLKNRVKMTLCTYGDFVESGDIKFQRCIFIYFDRFLTNDEQTKTIDYLKIKLPDESVEKILNAMMTQFKIIVDPDGAELSASHKG